MKAEDSRGRCRGSIWYQLVWTRKTRKTSRQRRQKALALPAVCVHHSVESVWG